MEDRRTLLLNRVSVKPEFLQRRDEGFEQQPHLENMTQGILLFLPFTRVRETATASTERENSIVRIYAGGIEARATLARDLVRELSI
ncbi:hypothetical protein V6N13_065059 [Hibiscus sabdariffa]